MITLRIPKKLQDEVKRDLARRHPFAYERIGFLYTRRTVSRSNGKIIVLGIAYEPVSDEDYVDDPTVGARINSSSIRKVMQRVLTNGEGVFHVHMHEHPGKPGLSRTDRDEIRPLMQSIRNASPENVHGLLLFSNDSAYAEALAPKSTMFQSVAKIAIVGFSMVLLANDCEFDTTADRFSRQSFLGEHAEQIITNTHVGIVGLGGGGSHIAQQLAHIGFSHFSLFDNDRVESSNLNRLVGATQGDVEEKKAKVDVASRVISSINPKASIFSVKSRWQDAPDTLHFCDLIFGCVDSYAERRDIEITARRFLIPYIDIGLDIHQVGDEAPRMAGQVILSMPGDLCMTCMGFLTESKVRREAEQYGAAGMRPQVVWANGVLASNAVGIAIDLITDWTKSPKPPIYLSYDSNQCTVQPHKRLEYLKETRCDHFPLDQVGEPRFKPL